MNSTPFSVFFSIFHPRSQHILLRISAYFSLLQPSSAIFLTRINPIPSDSFSHLPGCAPRAARGIPEDATRDIAGFLRWIFALDPPRLSVYFGRHDRTSPATNSGRRR
jgi:hypothetical protein